MPSREDSAPGGSNSSTGDLDHGDGDSGIRRDPPEFVDEPSSVAMDSYGLVASNTTSLAELVVASTSTVMSWWNQGGIECTVSSSDLINNPLQSTRFFTKRYRSRSGSGNSTTSNGATEMDEDPSENDSGLIATSSRGDGGPQSTDNADNEEGSSKAPRNVETQSISQQMQQALQRHRTQSRLQRKHQREEPPEVETGVIRDANSEDNLQKASFKTATSSLTESTANTSDIDNHSSASSLSSSSCSSFQTSETPSNKHTRSWAGKWEGFVKHNGDIIARPLGLLAREAAKNPYITIASLTLISFAVLAAGFFTNFSLVVDNSLLWPPDESFSVHQASWLYDQTNFTYDYRNVDMIIHANGDNVLTGEGVSRVFKALSVIRDMDDYKEGCKWADLVGDIHKVGECHIHSIGTFWNNTQGLFDKGNLTDSDVRKALSAKRYPSGQAVDLPRVIGNAESDSEGVLVHAQSFLIEFDLPWSYETEDFEWYALEEVLELQDMWKEEENNPFRLEVVAYRSYEDEFLRAIWLDLPLLPAVFMVVCAFCCIVFWRYDKVHSRTLLGIGAVVTIMLSIMTSFGLMFLFGVPFTTSTSMLPFLMFGIGLDDSFIIIGSYNRTHGTNILKRIEWTMKDVSVSICITTLTSALAFALGCFSDIPSVRWLCIYACPSFLIDFVYQITFFVALIVLDERRIQENRRDCCVWIHPPIHSGDKDDPEASWRTPTPPSQNKHWTDRFMGWYADKLLRPIPQAVVLVGFFSLLAVSMRAVFQLEQHFDMTDLVPQDSYLRPYYSSIRDFSKTRNGLPSYAFFRDVDQSDEDVQRQMLQFVDDLTETGAIAYRPTNFWLVDFLRFTNESELALEADAPFSEQVDQFLRQPLYNALYDDHITRDSINGTVIASRCEIYINDDLSDAKLGIAALERLRNVSESQPINEGLGGDDWKMFTYQDMYGLWEFYMAVLSELSFSTILGVVAVCVVGLLLIPHWSAVLFVAPMIVCLYVDMLGYISYTNVNVNAISYVQLVMSIGLMVDFIMHILMRYYECEGTRKERVKETLQTMGSSIFVGGVSSLLGVSLLAFSTSEILQLVFVAVLGLVVLGILHGLVFLPVILSLIGPL